MTGTEWLILDTETDGLIDPIHVVEIAAQRMRGWEPVGEKFRVLLNHGVPIPAAATAVHGYTAEFLRRNGADPLQAHSSFREFAADFPIVAHNLSFDWNRALCPEWRRLGNPQAGRKGFCSLMLSRRVAHETKRHSLEALRSTFGISANNAHRAFGDVESMVTLFKQVFGPRLQAAGIVSFATITEFARKTPVAKCLSELRAKPAAPPHSAQSVDSWYFIDSHNRTHGPLPAREILSLTGNLPCWVWQDGMSDWASSQTSTDFLQAAQTPPIAAPATRRRWTEDSSLTELMALCKGISADGVVNTKEVVFLSKWLEEAGGLHEWPATEIADTVEQILSDGVVTDQEQQQLLGLFARIDSQFKPDPETTQLKQSSRPAKQVRQTTSEGTSQSTTGIEIKLACSCGQRIVVNSLAGGQQFACPACGTSLHVPTLEESHQSSPDTGSSPENTTHPTTNVELTCVGNAGEGYLNAQIRVLWFEVIVDEARRTVDVVERYLPVKSHRREKRVNYCEYHVPEGVVCFYDRRVQIKPNLIERRFFTVSNGIFQVLAEGPQSDFYTRFLSNYSGYDISSGLTRQDAEENRRRRAEFETLGPGVHLMIRVEKDHQRPTRQTIAATDLTGVAQRRPGEEPATEKQLNFLRSLGVQNEDFLATLGKWQASSMIDHLLEKRDS